MLYKLDIFRFYFSEPLQFQIFFVLEIYKNLVLPLSTVTFTVNSHADNNFYKYLSFFQILYSMKFFLLKCTLRGFFIFIFGLNVTQRSYVSK